MRPSPTAKLIAGRVPAQMPRAYRRATEHHGPLVPVDEIPADASAGHERRTVGHGHRIARLQPLGATLQYSELGREARGPVGHTLRAIRRRD